MANSEVSRLKFNDTTYEIADELARESIGTALTEVASVDAKAEAYNTALSGRITNLENSSGAVLVAKTRTAMTDTSKIYVYTGTATTASGVTYTPGHWYYHNGSKWTDGGAYTQNLDAIDATLTQSNKGADAKVTGDRLTAAESDISKLRGTIANEYTSQAYAVGDYCYYNGLLYRCNTAISVGETWTSSHWTAVDVMPELNNLKNDITEYNCFDLIGKYGAFEDKVQAGVTFSWSGKKCTVTGSATDGAFCNVIIASGGLPSGIISGAEYFLVFNSTDSNIKMQLVSYVNGAYSATTTLSVSQPITIDETWSGFILRLYVAKNSAVNGAIAPALLNTKSNDELYRELLDARRNNAGVIYESVGTRTRIFEEIALKRVTITSNTATSDYNNDLSNLPGQIYAYILPSWFNISEVLKPNNGHWLFVYETSTGIRTYKLIDVTEHVVYYGFINGGVLSWHKMTNAYLKKKIANFGDSITWGRDGAGSATDRTTYTITKALNSLYEVEATNYGVGGMGYFETSGGMKALDKIQSVDVTEFDVITLAYGTNDNQALLGTPDDTDGTTILGAMYQCWQYIRSQNPACTVIFIAPPNASAFGTKATGYWYGYARGPLYDYTLTQLVAGMRSFCEKYHIPLIDNLDSFDVENISVLMPDGVHPSDDGYKVYSSYIARRIALYL